MKKIIPIPSISQFFGLYQVGCFDFQNFYSPELVQDDLTAIYLTHPRVVQTVGKKSGCIERLSLNYFKGTWGEWLDFSQSSHTSVQNLVSMVVSDMFASHGLDQQSQVFRVFFIRNIVWPGQGVYQGYHRDDVSDTIATGLMQVNRLPFATYLNIRNGTLSDMDMQSFTQYPYKPGRLYYFPNDDRVHKVTSHLNQLPYPLRRDLVTIDFYRE